MGNAARARTALLARALLLLLITYTGLRGLFLVLHADLFAGEPPAAVVGAFVRGIRFDLSAIAFSNIPFVLLALAPTELFRRPGYRRLLKGVFLVMNGFFFCVMVADLEYFTFTGTRATFESLYLTSEVGAQLDQLLLAYAPLTLLAVTLVWGLHRLYPATTGSTALPRRGGAGRWIGGGVFRVVCAGAVVLAARGGVQKKVLKPMNAFESGNQELGLLTLNSAFTLIQSPLKPEVERVAFFASDREAEVILAAPPGLEGGLGSAPGPRFVASADGEAPPVSTPAGPARPNVVLLILESFATEFWGAANGGDGLTPFLDSLAAEGVFLRNNFANGRRSIEALPSILLGVPSLASTAIAQSSYQGNQWRGLGHLLGDAGYHTSLFHGAPKGTMYFDGIASMAGIEEFHPLERYPRELQERDFDGHWGIFDEPYLQHVARVLGEQPVPFFSSVFTISTHQPYPLPEEYEGRLPESEIAIHRSVRYVDLAVRRFFDTIADEPWFSNTLFIVTADHTQNTRSPDYDTSLGRFMVPLLLYHPGLELPPVSPDRITQHVDLLPTVLDVAGVDPGRIPRFGRSVFSAAPGEAVLGSNGLYWLVREEGVLQRDPGGNERVFPFERHHTGGEPTGNQQLREALSRRLRAHLQHFSNSLILNSFYRGE